MPRKPTPPAKRGPGRPPSGRGRGAPVLYVRLTPDERARYEARADDLGRTLSEHTRALLDADVTDARGR